MKIKNYDEAMDALAPFLSEYLEEQGIDTSKHFNCINPNHEDNNPSCSIAPSKKVAHCFSCGMNASIFHAAHFLEGKPMIGQGFITQNLTPLAEKYGIDLETEVLTEEQIYELDTYRAYKAAADYIISSENTETFLEAIKERGWPEEIAKEFGVGCIKDYKKFREILKNLGFQASFLNDVDLSRTDIFSDDRLIYTIRDHHGRPVGFSSRNLNYNGDKSNGSKYVNQRGTGVKCNIYKKSTRLYGFDKVLKNTAKKPEPIYIFEGYSDVITASNNGIRNCVAISGTSLSLDQLYLLKRYNFYNIILCLDGDSVGQETTAKLLDSTLSGHKDLNIKILTLPDELDPDQFIRERGVEEFNNLRRWTAFEWRLSQFEEETESEEITESMIPLIINETSYVKQERMCKALSKATGFTLKTIQNELERLQNQKEAEKSRDRKNILDQLIEDCYKDPSQAEHALHKAENDLFDLARKYDEDSFSEEACLSFIQSQKESEEAKDGTFSGFILGPDLQPLQDALCGQWKKDVWLTLGGYENCGKTSMSIKLIYEIANHQENNACVIYHTIDDTAEQVLPKFICVAEGSRKLTLNQVMDPNYHVNNRAENKEELIERREIGYSTVANLVKNGRIIIRDANQGSSIAYIDSMIRYYKQKFPDRNIVYVLDNFHKLQDFGNKKGDERVRFKELSTVMKSLATKHHICLISTVEYTKRQANQKVSNNSISETVQISYDANLILHLNNELHEKAEKASKFHYGEDDNGSLIKMPTIELSIGKNKITAFKERLWFDFYPPNSDFVGIDEEIMISRTPEEEDNNVKIRKPFSS